MVSIYVTVYDIIKAEICITLTLTFKMAKIECKYANRKAIHILFIVLLDLYTALTC